VSTLFAGINVTASYFGDRVLGLEQIYQVVDNVFDSISTVSEDTIDYQHMDAIKNLVQDPLVQKMLAKDRDALNHDEFGSKTTSVETEASSQEDGSIVTTQNKKPFFKTRLDESSIMDVSEVSSVMLSPFAVIPVLGTMSYDRGDTTGPPMNRLLRAE
jgi:hypothetical protein